MRTLALVTFALVLAACSHPAPPAGRIDNRSPTAAPADAAPAGDGLPPDVSAFLERWEMCEHWAGEEPYSAARRDEIGRGIEESCPGNDETRARLETRYADRPDVIERLRALGDQGD